MSIFQQKLLRKASKKYYENEAHNGKKYTRIRREPKTTIGFSLKTMKICSNCEKQNENPKLYRLLNSDEQVYKRGETTDTKTKT